MKHDTTSKTPRFSPEFIAAAIAAAPEHVDDPDCPYDPNDAESVEAYFKGRDFIVSHSYEELKAKLAERRRRGVGKAPKKEPTTVRFSPDVLAAFRATGKGWQTRMNDALKDWLKTHQAA